MSPETAPSMPNAAAVDRQARWPTDPALPGATPYENLRPMFVAGRFDGLRLGEFLNAVHDHIPREIWQASADAGRLWVDTKPATLASPVRGGSRVEHLIPSTVEPDVAASLRFVFEDETLVVLSKPAPLPVHPSGRFNKNTVVGLIEDLHGERLRPVHRLDANVTGLLILAKTRPVARELAKQFERRSVQKRYLALVDGRLDAPTKIRDAIAGGPRGSGGRRRVESDGLSAETQLIPLRVRTEHSLVEVRPHSGRTNQIRIHLAHYGFPIVGDRVYGSAIAGDLLCLHAWGLVFAHPITGATLELWDKVPSWAAG